MTEIPDGAWPDATYESTPGDPTSTRWPGCLYAWNYAHDSFYELINILGLVDGDLIAAVRSVIVDAGWRYQTYGYWTRDAETDWAIANVVDAAVAEQARRLGKPPPPPRPVAWRYAPFHGPASGDSNRVDDDATIAAIRDGLFKRNVH